VVVKAATGIEAAKAGRMAAIGVARHGDEELLAKAGADLVVSDLDHVLIAALAAGRLEPRFVAELTRRQRERPPGAWTLVYEGFEPEHQGLREALCALGNGYFVTRGALPEARAEGINYLGTYVGGLYNRLQTPVAGRIVENEDLVKCRTGCRCRSGWQTARGSTHQGVHRRRPSYSGPPARHRRRVRSARASPESRRTTAGHD